MADININIIMSEKNTLIVHAKTECNMKMYSFEKFDMNVSVRWQQK